MNTNRSRIKLYLNSIILSFVIGGMAISFQNCGKAGVAPTEQAFDYQSLDLAAMFGLSDGDWAAYQKEREDRINAIMTAIPANADPDNKCAFTPEAELLFFDSANRVVERSVATNSNGTLKAGYRKEDPKTASARKGKCALTIERWRSICTVSAVQRDVVCCGGAEPSVECGTSGIFDIRRLVKGINTSATGTDAECLKKGPKIGVDLLVNCFDREADYNTRLRNEFGSDYPYHCVSVDMCKTISVDTRPPGTPPDPSPAAPRGPPPGETYSVTAMHQQPFVFGGSFSCEMKAGDFLGFNTLLETNNSGPSHVIGSSSLSLVPYCAETTQPLDFTPPGMGGNYYKQKFLELRMTLVKSEPKRYKLGKLIGSGTQAFINCASNTGLMYFVRPFYSDALISWLNYRPTTVPIPGAAGVVRCEVASDGNWYRVFQVTDADPAP